MTATPPRADLRTLAFEAIWNDGMGPVMSPEDLADAVLAAVLPEHQRMVRRETLQTLLDRSDSFSLTMDGQTAAQWLPRLIGDDDKAAEVLGRLAAAAPPAGLSAPVPAENAPAVPEDYPFAQIGRQAVESVLAFADALTKAYGPALSALASAYGVPAVPEEADDPAALNPVHEPDEPTDHIQAAFERGTHGRTAPPRGQTRRLDVAAPVRCARESDTLTYAEMESERDRLAGELYEANCELAVLKSKPLFSTRRAVPRRESTESTGYRYQELWQASARTAGWVPLADVLDALRNEDAVLRFAERHGDDLDGWWIENRDRERMRLYLAERFAPTTAPEGEHAG